MILLSGIQNTELNNIWIIYALKNFFKFQKNSKNNTIYLKLKIGRNLTSKFVKFEYETLQDLKTLKKLKSKN